MEKIIRENTDGKLFYSLDKNQFRVVFGIVDFNLSMEEYLVFERLLKSITKHLATSKSNTITLPINDGNLKLNLSIEEFMRFNDLFGFKTKNPRLLKLKINYSMN